MLIGIYEEGSVSAIELLGSAKNCIAEVKKWILPCHKSSKPY